MTSTAKRAVLIVGQLPDPHIDAVARELRRLGAAPLVFDRRCPEESHLSYRLEDGRAEGEIVTDQGRVHLSEVHAVWWRVKPFTLAEYGAEPTPVLQGFVDREWRSVLNSLGAFTPQAFWINPRAADLAAREKPVQLRTAQVCGLAIPPTYIGNDPQAVVAFTGAEAGPFVYKPVTWYADIPDRFIFTSQLDLAQVRHSAEEIQVAPGIFQRRMPKAYEVRATLVGGSVYAVRIDSQAVPGADLDWRRKQHRLNYTAHRLPEEVCERLLALQGKLELVYGAYDLIVTPDDEHIFLEVNPQGQWLWLEQRTGQPISRALAECLLQTRP